MNLPNPTATFRQIPPLGWVALAAFGGLMFLVWHSYQQDPYDTDWHDPHQPPTNVDINAADASKLPGLHQSALRSRYWPGTLTSSPASIVGLSDG